MIPSSRKRIVTMATPASVARLIITIIAIILPVILILVKEKSSFKTHACLMTPGVFLLLGFGVTSFRNLPFESHLIRKAFHSGANFLGFVLMIAGLVEAYTTKDNLQIKHFESVHSIMALMSIILFGLMLISGAILFNPFPKFPPDSLRTIFKPFHIAGGFATVAMTMGTWMTGIAKGQGPTQTDKQRAAGIFGIIAMGVIFGILSYRKRAKSQK